MKYKHNLSARNFELFCISYIYYSTYLRVCKCFYSYLRMEIIERITETLEKTDKKATDLCDRLGIRTSTMSTWKTRNSDPPAKYIKPIADFLGVSVHYLLTGEEAPARKLTTAEEDELLELYRALPQNKQFEFIGELKGFLKAYTESQKYLDKEKRLSV